MGPLLRLSILMGRLVRRPPSRRVAVSMLVALGVAVTLVLIERHFGWPEGLRTEPLPLRRLAP